MVAEAAFLSFSFTNEINPFSSLLVFACVVYA
jgi:hypothetical protein